MSVALCDSREFSYQKFNLKECENQLRHYCQDKGIDGVAYANYFIISKNMLEKDNLIIVDEKQCYRIKKSERTKTGILN